MTSPYRCTQKQQEQHLQGYFRDGRICRSGTSTVPKQSLTKCRSTIVEFKAICHGAIWKKRNWLEALAPGHYLNRSSSQLDVQSGLEETATTRWTRNRRLNQSTKMTAPRPLGNLHLRKHCVYCIFCVTDTHATDCMQNGKFVDRLRQCCFVITELCCLRQYSESFKTLTGLWIWQIGFKLGRAIE